MANLVYIFIVATLCYGSNAQTIYANGKNVTNRESFAYQVSLRDNSKHICGGTIYNSKFVITSASCINGTTASNLEIVAGDLNLLKPTNQTQKVKVDKIIVHDKFNKTINDIAIIKLSKALRFDNFTKGVEVLKKWNDTNTSGGKCVVSGWGANVTQTARTFDLYAANVSILSNQTCRTFNRDLSDGMLCAGEGSNLVNICVDDAGGPLICNGVLYGIASLRTQCQVPNNPGIYTNTTYYDDWIRHKTNNAQLISPIFLLSSVVLIFNLFQVLIN